MKKKSLVLLLAACVLSSTMLSGCGDSSSKKDETTTAKEKTTKHTVSDTTEEEDTSDETDGEELKGSDFEGTEVGGTGYTIKIPSDWTKYNNDAADIVYTYLLSGADGFTENISVTIQDLTGYDMDLEAYKELSEKQYDQLGYTVTTIEPVTINDVDGYYVECNAEQSGIMCYFSQFFTTIDNSAYVFTFAADEDGFDKLSDTVKNVYSTIEFTK